MRKIFAILVMSALLLLCGCGGQSGEQDGDKAGVTVAVSVDALADITRTIGSERVEVISLVPDGVEIHDYEPSPRDVEKVANAELVVLNGLGLEPWFEDSAFSDIAAKIRVVSDDLADSLIEVDGVTDPHIWMSPLCAADIATSICNALIEIDPDGAEYYVGNLDALLEELSEVFNEYRAIIKPGTVIVTSHEAFGYLCRDFEITEKSVRGIYAEGEPSPKQLAELIEFCLENEIKHIYSETNAGTEVADTLARECGSQVVAVYTMESAEDGLDYVTRLRSNLEKIAANS